MTILLIRVTNKSLFRFAKVLKDQISLTKLAMLLSLGLNLLLSRQTLILFIIQIHFHQLYLKKSSNQTLVSKTNRRHNLRPVLITSNMVSNKHSHKIIMVGFLIKALKAPGLSTQFHKLKIIQFKTKDNFLLLVNMELKCHQTILINNLV
jgi:hypothetical protein